jgi:hypothetical protein
MWTDLLIVLPLALIPVLVGMSAVFVARDAERRGMDRYVPATITFFTWPVGLVLWMLFRPRNRSRFSS